MRSGYYPRMIMISDNIVKTPEYVWDKVNETKMSKYLEKIQR